MTSRHREVHPKGSGPCSRGEFGDPGAHHAEPAKQRVAGELWGTWGLRVIKQP